MESSQTLRMTGVNISEVGTGVWVKQGTLTMTRGSIEFKGNGNGKGLSVQNAANATITGTTIRGMDGQGTGVFMESSGTLNMTGVTISNVEKGVEATAGNLM
ncbi:right-handed parallel beta-helix repeat-containing protein, partial [Bartonella bovis]|uniref:right-handed parallel beta-helix repeat-containing protein n=1 Tax=Bartonella bovis TaxID=155194 RepID=UPI001FCF15F5